jgi:acetolactate synthase regulatory subunit
MARSASKYEIDVTVMSDRIVVNLTDKKEKIVAVGSGVTIVEAFTDAYDLITTQVVEV